MVIKEEFIVSFLLYLHRRMSTEGKRLIALAEGNEEYLKGKRGQGTAKPSPAAVQAAKKAVAQQLLIYGAAKENDTTLLECAGDT